MTRSTLSLRSVSRRRSATSRLYECTPCRSIPSASPCRRQAKIERAQIVLDRSQPGLPGSSGSASPVFRRTPNAGLESSGIWSWLASARQRWPKKDRRRRRIVSDRSGCPVRDRTTSLETKSLQWMWRIRLRHQVSNASIFFAMVEITDGHQGARTRNPAQRDHLSCRRTTNVRCCCLGYLHQRSRPHIRS